MELLTYPNQEGAFYAPSFNNQANKVTSPARLDNNHFEASLSSKVSFMNASAQSYNPHGYDPVILTPTF